MMHSCAISLLQKGEEMIQELEKRRSFLKQILAGTVAVLGSTTAVKPAKAKSVLVVRGKDEVLYQESENFKKYYKILKS